MRKLSSILLEFVYKVANFLKTWRVWLRMFEFDASQF